MRIISSKVFVAVWLVFSVVFVFSFTSAFAEKQKIQDEVFYVGPADLHPSAHPGHEHGSMGHEMVDLPLHTFKLPYSGWIVDFIPEMVTGNGEKLPGRLLHHGVFFNPARTDRTCMMWPERFLASGGELTWVTFPEGTGYYLRADEPFTILTEMHNPFSTHYHDVYFRFTFKVAPDTGQKPLQHVTPYWFDISNCGDSQFDVPQGKQEKTWEWKMQEFATWVTLVPHLHEYGVDLTLENTTEGKVIWKGEAKLDQNHNIVSMTRRVEVGPETKPGQTLLLKAHYDNSSGDTIKGAMGIMLSWALTGKEPERLQVSIPKGTTLLEPFVVGPMRVWLEKAAKTAKIEVLENGKKLNTETIFLPMDREAIITSSTPWKPGAKYVLKGEVDGKKIELSHTMPKTTALKSGVYQIDLLESLNMEPKMLKGLMKRFNLRLPELCVEITGSGKADVGMCKMVAGKANFNQKESVSISMPSEGIAGTEPFKWEINILGFSIPIERSTLWLAATDSGVEYAFNGSLDAKSLKNLPYAQSDEVKPDALKFIDPKMVSPCGDSWCLMLSAQGRL